MPIEPDIAASVAQLGAAGLVAWMWLTERRAAADRERRLTEAHERIMEQRAHVDALVRLVEGNTRALTALEASQRAVADALHRMSAARWPRPAGSGEPPERAAPPSTLTA